MEGEKVKTMKADFEEFCVKEIRGRILTARGIGIEGESLYFKERVPQNISTSLTDGSDIVQVKESVNAGEKGMTAKASEKVSGNRIWSTTGELAGQVFYCNRREGQEKAMTKDKEQRALLILW